MTFFLACLRPQSQRTQACDPTLIIKCGLCLNFGPDLALVFMYFLDSFFSVKEKDVILKEMHSEVAEYKDQLTKLKKDLEEQRSKNNVSVNSN